MADEVLELDEIDATPTKRLFIDILTRDVTVKHCILDLIDNSVDAYIRNDLTDRREIKLHISKNEFQISDNCGGIEYNFLKENVFRFGAEIFQSEKPTLGVYGIGLKRAILKIGRIIRMETDDGVKFCNFDLNVDEWEQTNIWKIPLHSSDSQTHSAGSDKYTKIIINDLYDHIQEKFDLDSFINEMIKSIHITYAYFILNNIDFYVNDYKIEPYILEVRSDDQYQPVKIKESFDDVEIEITCYIDPRKTRTTKELGQRGWNIFCNKRLILVEDTSSTTGWTGDKAELPKYHNLYHDFRGVVFLHSDDPSKLPLNTSKSGIDEETPIYDYIRNLMIKTARPIIDYLSKKYDEEVANLDMIEEKLDEEIIEEEEEKDVEIRLISLEKIDAGSIFKAPVKQEPKVKLVNISYKKPETLVKKVKKSIEARSNKEIGEDTFDYYVDLEGIENE